LVFNIVVNINIMDTTTAIKQQPPSTPTHVVAPPTTDLHITVKAANDDGTVFRVKRNLPFGKIFLKFIQVRGLGNDVAASGLRFLYDGVRVKEADTPESLNITEDTTIDAVIMQTGGCC
jgi:hypothetical protein